MFAGRAVRTATVRLTLSLTLAGLLCFALAQVAFGLAGGRYRAVLPPPTGTTAGRIAHGSDSLGQDIGMASWGGGPGPARESDLALLAAKGVEASGGGVGRLFVNTAEGHTVPVPDNFVARVADNGQGLVYQEAGAVDNANMVRIMDPTARYPQGYMVYYNSNNQALDAAGNIASRATHPAGGLRRDSQATTRGWSSSCGDYPRIGPPPR